MRRLVNESLMRSIVGNMDRMYDYAGAGMKRLTEEENPFDDDDEDEEGEGTEGQPVSDESGEDAPAPSAPPPAGPTEGDDEENPDELSDEDIADGKGDGPSEESSKESAMKEVAAILGQRYYSYIEGGEPPAADTINDDLAEELDKAELQIVDKAGSSGLERLSQLAETIANGIQKRLEHWVELSPERIAKVIEGGIKRFGYSSIYGETEPDDQGGGTPFEGDWTTKDMTGGYKADEESKGSVKSLETTIAKQADLGRERQTARVQSLSLSKLSQELQSEFNAKGSVSLKDAMKAVVNSSSKASPIRPGQDRRAYIDYVLKNKMRRDQVLKAIDSIPNDMVFTNPSKLQNFIATLQRKQGALDAKGHETFSSGSRIEPTDEIEGAWMSDFADVRRAEEDEARAPEVEKMLAQKVADIMKINDNDTVGSAMPKLQRSLDNMQSAIKDAQDSVAAGDQRIKDFEMNNPIVTPELQGFKGALDSEFGPDEEPQEGGEDVQHFLPSTRDILIKRLDLKSNPRGRQILDNMESIISAKKRMNRTIPSDKEMKPFEETKKGQEALSTGDSTIIAQAQQEYEDRKAKRKIRLEKAQQDYQKWQGLWENEPEGNNEETETVNPDIMKERKKKDESAQEQKDGADFVSLLTSDEVKRATNGMAIAPSIALFDALAEMHSRQINHNAFARNGQDASGKYVRDETSRQRARMFNRMKNMVFRAEEQEEVQQVLNVLTNRWFASGEEPQNQEEFMNLNDMRSTLISLGDSPTITAYADYLKRAKEIVPQNLDQFKEYDVDSLGTEGRNKKLLYIGLPGTTDDLEPFVVSSPQELSEIFQLWFSGDDESEKHLRALFPVDIYDEYIAPHINRLFDTENEDIVRAIYSMDQETGTPFAYNPNWNNPIHPIAELFPSIGKKAAKKKRGKAPAGPAVTAAGNAEIPMESFNRYSNLFNAMYREICENSL